jgi:excisionase family DNA binding protein
METLITTTEAAELLGVGRTTIFWLIQNGTLEGLKVPEARGRGSKRRGFVVFVRRSDVEKIQDGSWRRMAPRKTNVADNGSGGEDHG